MDDTSDVDGNTVGSLDGWSLKIDNALHAVPAGTQADRIAKAILSDQSTFVNASFDDTKLNAESTPNGYATPQGPDILFDNNTATLAGFPQLPSTDFAILTSGDANLADDTPQTQSESSGTGDGGSPVDVPSRGDTAFDVSTLRIGVNVPAGANCLSLDYRFLSEEFPEFVGTNYNDAFIAELDTSTWTTSGSTISAPNDFATHTGASGVNVNGVGPVAVSAAEASDTTYDAATGLVTTKTPITPGAHTVILSIFDQGDSAYDSAAFVDNLRFITEDPSTCTPPFVAQTPVPRAAAAAAAPAARAAIERVHGRQQDRVQERFDDAHDHGPGAGRAAGGADGRRVTGADRPGAGREEEEGARQDRQGERREGRQGQGDAQADGRRQEGAQEEGQDQAEDADHLHADRRNAEEHHQDDHHQAQGQEEVNAA